MFESLHESHGFVTFVFESTSFPDNNAVIRVLVDFLESTGELGFHTQVLPPPRITELFLHVV